MPKVKIAAGDFSGVDAAVGFNDYVGPTPPKGVYRTKTTLWRLTTNSKGDQMFKIIFTIDEPKGSKNAKYNGYAIWHNANLTQKSAPFVNAMLDALGVSRKAVWVAGVVTSRENPEDVVKIGGKSPIGLVVAISTRRKEYPVGSGEWQLEARTFLEASEADLSEVDEDDDDDEDFEDDDEDSEEDDSDDDDDDDEEAF